MGRAASRRRVLRRIRLGWRAVALLILVPLAGIGVGFLLFAAVLPGPAPAGLVTDGAVVLTGGTGRLARGAEVLRAGLAGRLLVSGVDRRVRAEELRRAMGLSPERFRRVDLGFAAENTRANAEEVAEWVAAHRFRSVRLVTSDFHARRARLEIAARLPEGVTLVIDAVPSNPDLPRLWREYLKYLAARGRLLLLAA